MVFLFIVCCVLASPLVFLQTIYLTSFDLASVLPYFYEAIVCIMGLMHLSVCPCLSLSVHPISALNLKTK